MPDAIQLNSPTRRLHGRQTFSEEGRNFGNLLDKIFPRSGLVQETRLTGTDKFRNSSKRGRQHESSSCHGLHQHHQVLLVESFDRELVVSAFRSGVRGICCIADSNLRLLCKCLLRVANGQIWANTEQLNYVVELLSEVPSLRVLNLNGDILLTPREEQVVALVAEGLGNRPIVRQLNLSEHTVKKYLFRIFEKLGISSRLELVLYAVNNGDPRHAEWLAGATRVLPNA